MGMDEWVGVETVELGVFIGVRGMETGREALLAHLAFSLWFFSIPEITSHTQE